MQHDELTLNQIDKRCKCFNKPPECDRNRRTRAISVIDRLKEPAIPVSPLKSSSRLSLPKMQRNCDEDSGRSSCSAASLAISPVIDYAAKLDQGIKRRYITKQQDLTNTELKVSSRPRSCINLIKSPDEKDPFPSYRLRQNCQKNNVLSVFNVPRKGGLSSAHSTLDIASSTQIEHPKLQTNAHATSLNAVAVFSDHNPVAQPSNFKRTKPVQRVASRLYKADAPKGHKSSCVGPEFIVRASQPPKQIDLTLSAFSPKRTIVVVLLNGQKFELLCDPNIVTAGQLFEAIVLGEKYEHHFMLGLAALIGGDFIFLPDEYKIKKIAPEKWCIKPGAKKKIVEDILPITLFLRIKFFLPTNIARNIQGGEWRHRVYSQLRRSCVEGQLTSTLQNLIMLAGYALHIEFGEFSYREHGTADYFLLEHYLPESSITTDNMLDVKLRMKRAHESRRGLEKNTAILSFISLAQTFRDYGAHFYSAVWATRDGFCRDVWLSIGPKGVTLYSRTSHVSGDEGHKNRLVLQNLPWHHIHTFYYNKKCLYIIPNSNSGLSKIGVKYKLRMSDNKSYFAFWLASLHHRLYLKLYSKEDFISYFLDELSCPINRQDCSNFQDSYNLAVRNNPLRFRKPIKKRFRVDIFNDKKAQNKENQKPNTEELLRQILVPQNDETIENLSPTSNTQGNSSNDGLSSSESCSLPRRHGVKMGTRVFNGMKSRLTTSPMSNYSTQLRKSEDFATTQSDSDDLGSTIDHKQRHCNVNSMKLLPERQYNTDQGPTAFVLESPKVYAEVFNYNATNNESCFNTSLFQKLDTMGCVQGERVFVTASLERDENGTLGVQVAEGSDGNVYVKSITSGGPADLSKKLLAGDQIISVNGQTLLNVKYDKALSMLQSAPAKVELIVLQNASANGNEEPGKSSVYETSNTALLTQPKNMMRSIASGLEDLEITDDELLNEEALKTIYALIKLTKEKVISRIKDKENIKSSNMNKSLSKSYSANVVFEETDVFSSQENTPQKNDSLKFNTWRGIPNHRPKRRPLSLSIPSDVHLTEDYLDDDLTNEMINKASLKSIQSSINSLDTKSMKSSSSSRNVALPRNFGLGRKWVGPVRYPVTPCKNVEALNKESALNNHAAIKRFAYGMNDSDDDQIFL